MNAAGKAIIAVAGFIWGLARTTGSANPPMGWPRPDAAPGAPDETASRLDRLEAVVLGVSRPSPPARPTANERFVTEQDLATALREAENRIRQEVSDRMRSQGLAIDSLREMIEETEALLERVLERLETFADDAARESSAAERTAPDRMSPRGPTSVSDLRASGRP